MSGGQYVLNLEKHMWHVVRFSQQVAEVAGDDLTLAQARDRLTSTLPVNYLLLVRNETEALVQQINAVVAMRTSDTQEGTWRD